MTDWNTPEDVPADTVDRLHRWLLQEGNPADAATPGERAVADIIRTFWPVPPRTLAEGLEYRADLLDNGDPDGDTANVLRTLATDAIQMEHDLAEARAEVERLTAERTSKESLPVDQPDPADVKPGEAWIVEVNEERRNAVKDCSPYFPWDTVSADDGYPLTAANEDVTLVTRMVPAPRVITNPDELDRLCPNSVILSADNDAWQKSSETSMWASAWWATSDGEPSMWVSYRLCDEDHPATVLWEPGA